MLDPPTLRGDRIEMTDQEILDGCSRVLGELLDDESLMLTMTTRRRDVPGWDSLSYISFIAAIEVEFGVKFGIVDVESFEDVGAIVRRTQALRSRVK
jgi:acyl carrier protein